VIGNRSVRRRIVWPLVAGMVVLAASVGPANAVGQPAATFTCPTSPSQVTLPEVNAPVRVPGKPYSITYRALPLTFTAIPPGAGSLCTVRSNRGALPVNITIPEPFTMIHVADSVTTATLDFYPADAPVTDVPTCDFSGLSATIGSVVSRITGAPGTTDDCLLATSEHTSGDVIARWSIPGFVEYVPGEQGAPVYSTRPLTYFVDLDALPPGSSDQLQELETYVHLTLIGNLPVVDPIGIIQDPPAHLFITDPSGRTVGLGQDGTVRTFTGAGYTEIGDRSIAWILTPVAGNYHVTASGSPGSPFTTDFAISAIQDVLWQGILGQDGTLSRVFTVPAHQ
jgi:hypothetical protein